MPTQSVVVPLALVPLETVTGPGQLGAGSNVSLQLKVTMTSCAVGVPGVYGSPSVAVFIVAVMFGADLSMRIGPKLALVVVPATFTA